MVHSGMRVISAIEDPAVAHRILDHLGLATRAPPRGKPWSAQRALALERSADQGADPPSAFE